MSVAACSDEISRREFISFLQSDERHPPDQILFLLASPPLASAAPGDFLGTVYRVPPPLQARKNCGTPLLYILPHVVDNRQGAGGCAICKHEQMS